MTTFDSYAQYYDLFYLEKAYADEATFVLSELRAHGTTLVRLLDLGCGTGIHALRLATLGCCVHGVDISQDMLERASHRRADVGAEIGGRLFFHRDDIRKFRLPESFDAVISLFHVMSYQTKDSDVAAAIATARDHLQPGGVFLFDFWYGPAVIASGPTTRRREVENEATRIVRVATPLWDKAQNVVNVQYHFTVVSKKDGRTLEFSETHAMRYFFTNDLERLLLDGGFRPIKCAEWLTAANPSDATFSTYMLAVAC